MVRVLLGIIKGGLVGAAIGFGALKLGVAGIIGWLIYGLVGFLVGIVCGKPIWRQETLWTPILKGIFGFAACLGLYFLGSKFLGDFRLPFVANLGFAEADGPLMRTPLLLAPVLGILYGVFVEIDDGDRKGGGPAKDSAKS